MTPEAFADGLCDLMEDIRELLRQGLLVEERDTDGTVRYGVPMYVAEKLRG